MKQYFLSCRAALQSRILLAFGDRQYFAESSHLYSMRDLTEVRSGELLPFLMNVHAKFARHIREECEVSFPLLNWGVEMGEWIPLLDEVSNVRPSQNCDSERFVPPFSCVLTWTWSANVHTLEAPTGLLYLSSPVGASSSYRY